MNLNKGVPPAMTTQKLEEKVRQQDEVVESNKTEPIEGTNVNLENTCP